MIAPQHGPRGAQGRDRRIAGPAAFGRGVLMPPIGRIRIRRTMATIGGERGIAPRGPGLRRRRGDPAAKPFAAQQDHPLIPDFGKRQSKAPAIRRFAQGRANLVPPTRGEHHLLAIEHRAQGRALRDVSRRLAGEQPGQREHGRPAQAVTGKAHRTPLRIWATWPVLAPPAACRYKSGESSDRLNKERLPWPSNAPCPSSSRTPRGAI